MRWLKLLDPRFWILFAAAPPAPAEFKPDMANFVFPPFDESEYPVEEFTEDEKRVMETPAYEDCYSEEKTYPEIYRKRMLGRTRHNAFSVYLRELQYAEYLYTQAQWRSEWAQKMLSLGGPR